MNFNPNIQGARGLFAMMIFVFHVLHSKLPAPALFDHGLAESAYLSMQYGVELFFCISGFVIAGTLRRARSPAQFLADRAIRIFPVLWATMPFVLILEYLAGFDSVRSVSSLEFLWFLLANLLCLPTIFPIPLFHAAAWSLSYEMAFYAICTAGWAIRRQGYAASVVGFPAAVLLFLYPRGAFFLVGVVVAEGLADRPFLRRAARMPLLCMAVCLAAWCEVWRLSPEGAISVMGWWNDFRLPLALLSLAAAVPFFQGLSDGNGILGRMLRLPVWQWMGKISYSFYLWQFLVMAIVKQGMYQTGLVEHAGMLSQPLFLLISLPPTLLVSRLSQEMLEERFSRRLRHRLTKPQPINQAAGRDVTGFPPDVPAADAHDLGPPQPKEFFRRRQVRKAIPQIAAHARELDR